MIIVWSPFIQLLYNWILRACVFMQAYTLYSAGTASKKCKTHFFSKMTQNGQKWILNTTFEKCYIFCRFLEIRKSQD